MASNTLMYRIEIPNDVRMSLCERLVKLQKDIWQLSDRDVLPPWKLFITPKIGNILMIGFKSKKPVALAVFTMALDKASNEPYLYLDMIGVSPKHEGCGLAFNMLKRAKAIARKRNLKSIRWTYDPLMANNANLYIKKLGATVNKYYEDYYTNLSGINSGIPIDRLWAVLPTKSRRKTSKAPSITISINDYPKTSILIKPMTRSIAIEIPDNIVDIKRRSVKNAINVRLASRKTFQTLFSRGYIINGFCRKNGRNFYIATKGNV